jgi:hypothetical protein
VSKYPLHRIIQALRTHHGLLTLAADELGCSRQTLYNYAARYPAVAEVLSEERERFIDLAEQGLMAHLQQQNSWAISLTLRTLGRRRGYEDKPAPPGPSDSGSAQEWEAIQVTLLEALREFPEARWAVARALGEHTRESENGHSSGT